MKRLAGALLLLVAGCRVAADADLEESARRVLPAGFKVIHRLSVDFDGDGDAGACLFAVPRALADDERHAVIAVDGGAARLGLLPSPSNWLKSAVEDGTPFTGLPNAAIRLSRGSTRQGVLYECDNGSKGTAAVVRVLSVEEGRLDIVQAPGFYAADPWRVVVDDGVLRGLVYVEVENVFADTDPPFTYHGCTIRWDGRQFAAEHPETRIAQRGYFCPEQDAKWLDELASALAVTPDAPAVTEAPTKDHASKRGTTPAPDTVPSGSQRASTIAFIREGNIWLMDPDGADQRQLSHSGKCAHPSWSPDGKSLVFESSGDVWRMELPNQRLQRLTTTGDCHQPAWRPGTDEVWYLRFERVSEWQGYWATIWAVASAGTARKVARIEDRIWEPTRTTWRADGKLLALDIVVANSDVAYAGFFAPDGSQLRIKMEGRNQPWAESVAAQLSPSWCPTDQDLVVSTVVYWGDTPQMPNGSLVVLDQGTGFVRDLMDDREGVPSTPSWSPSGDRIAFCRGSGHSFAVWVIAADGEGLRKIADNAEQPAWSAAP